jgi:hypothetical protein
VRYLSWSLAWIAQFQAAQLGSPTPTTAYRF